MLMCQDVEHKRYYNGNFYIQAIYYRFALEHKVALLANYTRYTVTNTSTHNVIRPNRRLGRLIKLRNQLLKTPPPPQPVSPVSCVSDDDTDIITRMADISFVI